MAMHRAIESFAYQPAKGPEVKIQDGQAYSDDDKVWAPIIKRFSDWFVAEGEEKPRPTPKTRTTKKSK